MNVHSSKHTTAALAVEARKTTPATCQPASFVIVLLLGVMKEHQRIQAYKRQGAGAPVSNRPRIAKSKSLLASLTAQSLSRFQQSHSARNLCSSVICVVRGIANCFANRTTSKVIAVLGLAVLHLVGGPAGSNLLPWMLGDRLLHSSPLHSNQTNNSGQIACRHACSSRAGTTTDKYFLDVCTTELLMLICILAGF